MSAASAPLVSVVLPTYNRVALLREAIASVRAQSFEEWELIVADDGSTDETRAMLDAIDDPRVRPLWLPHSGNPAVPRNAGIAASRGAWIGFLDSDDLWLPEKLALQLRAMESHPLCGWCYTGFALVDEEGTPLPERPSSISRPVSGWILPALLEFLATPSQPSLLVRRTLLHEIGGFDESGTLREDYDLILRMAAASEVHALPEVLTLVREHRGRTTSQFGRAALHGLNERVFRKAAAAATSARLRRLCRRQCARQLADMARAASADGRHRTAFHLLGRAMRDAPTLGAVWRATAGCTLRAVRLRPMTLQ